MSSDNVAILAENLGKCYEIYATPRDRLKQFVMPPLYSRFRKKTKNYFREFWAVRDVSFEIKKGQTVGIIGRNGSGKSTLLQMICGTLHPSRGSVRTSGRIAALLELGSGFNPEFTGRENVYLNASVLGLSLNEIDDRFDSIEAFADIGDFISQPVKTYSSGMLVRLAFAVIAHVDADILIIDEALAVGDAFFTQKCMRFLRGFMKSGTVLFVSHDVGAVRALCSEAIWIENGSVQKRGTPKEVCECYLEAFYEDQQGKSVLLKFDKAIDIPKKDRPSGEQGPASASVETLADKLRVFEFDPGAASFGKGGAAITSVQFLTESGEKPLDWINGGEGVLLRIHVLAGSELSSPIVGFFVKDKLGQPLFGDNTWLSYMDSPMTCRANQILIAEFAFQMPRLVAGDYTITAAIADGSQEEHVQHHWIHDAVSFKSVSGSLSTGLIGIPMRDIQLRIGGGHA